MHRPAFFQIIGRSKLVLNEFLKKQFDRASELNENNILSLFEKAPEAYFIDLGCDDGTLTMKIAGKIGTKFVTGIDVTDESLKSAAEKGIKTIRHDLNDPFSLFDDSYFDIVHANQVIEHISNLDNFVSEIHRILKRGGYAVISTENGSSWHNIFAGIMGWQIFSLTNISMKAAGIGNPLALHRNTKSNIASWTHKTIFNYRGLIEFLKIHGFKIEAVRGAGYYPFPARLGTIDVRHSHFITVKIVKN